MASGEFSISVFANCTVQTTITADPAPLPPGARQSSAEPLVTMYNRVSDNLEVDAEPCKSAALVQGKPGKLLVHFSNEYVDLTGYNLIFAPGCRHCPSHASAR